MKGNLVSNSLPYLLEIFNLKCYRPYVSSFSLYSTIDLSGKSNKRHISGSESIQTNNSQAPLTNSVGDKTAYLGHKRRSLFAIESLMFLSILGTQTGRLNDMHRGDNKVSN